MNKPVVVIGAGGHAKVVIDALLLLDVQVLCLTDTDPAKHGASVLGIPVLDEDSLLTRYPPDTADLAMGVGSVRVSQFRREIFERLKSSGYRFKTIVHPSTSIGRDVVLGEGCQIMAGVVIQTGSILGVNVLINTRAVVDHDCEIGDHVHIGPGAVLSGHVTLDADCHIGCGASVIQGIRLGNNVQVGAGAAVVNDFGNGARVLGVPGRRLSI